MPHSEIAYAICNHLTYSNLLRSGGEKVNPSNDCSSSSAQSDVSAIAVILTVTVRDTFGVIARKTNESGVNYRNINSFFLTYVRHGMEAAKVALRATADENGVAMKCRQCKLCCCLLAATKTTRGAATAVACLWQCNYNGVQQLWGVKVAKTNATIDKSNEQKGDENNIK
ncbi:unnamed protein product [Ceratitis capitata]|uniref:(Mediterranean fruit fly) hypothetical protein n=1 Tax=Ceratitis capitata TaxID=7213 RepID=A0A811V959_CERCA|nr:unnamed protein product [Ceratitis capitata]